MATAAAGGAGPAGPASGPASKPSPDDCPICFSELRGPSLSLACGHIFHTSCLQELLTFDLDAPCPSCRAPLALDRVKAAEAVPGALKCSSGFGNFAARSGPSDAGCRPLRQPAAPRPAAPARQPLQPATNSPAALAGPAPAAAAVPAAAQVPQQQLLQPAVPAFGALPPSGLGLLGGQALPIPRARDNPLLRALPVQMQEMERGVLAELEQEGLPTQAGWTHSLGLDEAGSAAAWDSAMAALGSDLEGLGLGLGQPAWQPAHKAAGPAENNAVAELGRRLAGLRQLAQPARGAPPGLPQALWGGRRGLTFPAAPGLQHRWGPESAPPRAPPPALAPKPPTPREQVTARVLRAIPRLARLRPGPSNMVFCIDVSTSMGEMTDWSPASCSRLSLALTYMACFVDRGLAPGDKYSVLTFSADCNCIVDWRERAASFDKEALLRECEASIQRLRRGGTSMFSAWTTAYQRLRLQATSDAGAGDAAGGAASQAAPAAAAAAPAARSPPPRVQQLVLLTDGEATDGAAFERAHQLACCPVPGFDFRAFLIKIEDGEEAYLENQIGKLATDTQGQPIPYVVHRAFALPAHFDTEAPVTQSALQSLSGATRTFGGLASSASLPRERWPSWS